MITSYPTEAKKAGVRKNLGLGRRAFLWLCLILILLGASGFGSCHSRPRRPDPSQGPTVVIRNQAKEDWAIRVELARTEEEKARGLMWRWSLPPDHGMLFIYDSPQLHTFWMKNTRLPLDMIFIAGDKTIAGIVENAEPYTETPRRIDQPSQFVLEVNGGECKKHGVAAGDQVFFFGIPGLE